VAADWQRNLVDFTEYVMFSIDYPFESTEPAVQFIRTAPLAPADQARVAHVDAERILRLHQ
jgi:2,3-dihydroxybenzoate decarboxylase